MRDDGAALGNDLFRSGWRMETLIFRVDAFPEIGTGHLMRCLALAQAWKDRGGAAIFLSYCSNKAVLARHKEEGFLLHLLDAPCRSAAEHEVLRGVLAPYAGAWVVLDGYHFAADCQQFFKRLGHRLLVIDDMAHLEHYCADIVLNQNLHAVDLRYNSAAHTKLLLGPSYVLLRREFRAWRGYEKSIPEHARKLLITLGGADVRNFSEKVFLALRDVPELELTVLLGGGNPHLQRIESLVRKGGACNRVLHAVVDVARLMSEMDLAVSAGGTTVWELAFMGVPSLVGKLTDIEQYLLAGIEKQGLFAGLGWFEQMRPQYFREQVEELAADRKKRERMSARGRRLVPGYGCEHVIEAMIRK